MKPRNYIWPSISLVVGLMLPVTCLAPCAEKKENPEKHRAEKIAARIVNALEDWSSKPELTRPSYDDVIRQTLDLLDQEEIRLVAQYVHSIDVEEEAFKRWARFNPAGALKAVRAIEDSNAEEIRLAGTGFEGGPGEAMSEWVFGMYLGALDGWSEVAPKAAWEAFKKREGPLSKSLVVEEYLHEFYQVLFNHLAKADPDLAFQELIVFRDDKYEDMFTASMLAGYLHGAPRGRDWGKEANRLIERTWTGGWLYAEIRTALMGRWLEDAPKAAEKWFSEGDVEDLHWSFVESPNSDLDPIESDANSAEHQQATKEKKRNHLGSAAGYWAARDFPAAWRWMKSYSAFRQEGFGQAVLHGMDVCRSHRPSYFLGGEGAGTYFLQQAALLPDQSDRMDLALLFANVFWSFDDTEFLGEPPPDKAKWLVEVRREIVALRLEPEAANTIINKLRNKGHNERGGAGQVPTRSDAEVKGGDKPQPESEGRSQ